MTVGTRSDVLEAAESWVGTPFHDGASIKGVGVDCAMLLRAVYFEAGVTPLIEVASYPPQWYMHRNEELFLSYLTPIATEIPAGRAADGDVALFKFGRCFAHGAILVEAPRKVIHATPNYRSVTYGEIDMGELAGRETRYFTFWP